MLAGRKIYLRRLEKEDLERSSKWINDPRIFITMGVWGPRNKSEQADWFEGIAKSRTNLIFALCLRETDEHIGNVSLFDVDLRNRNAGMTIFIYDQQFYGKGLGTEAVSILCEYAFNYLNLHKVYCKTNEQAAKRLYERLGFVLEGVQREQAYHNGKYIDKAIYGLLAHDFKPAT